MNLEKFFELVLSDCENVIDLLYDYDSIDVIQAHESCWVNDEFINDDALYILEKCAFFDYSTDEYYYKDRNGYIHGLKDYNRVETFYKRQLERIPKNELLDSLTTTKYENYLDDELIEMLDEYTGKKDGTININELKKGDMFICDNIVYRIIGGESCTKQALSLEKLDIYSLYHFRNKACYKVD